MKLAQTFDLDGSYAPTKIAAYLKIATHFNGIDFFDIDKKDYDMPEGVCIDALNFKNIEQEESKLIPFDDIDDYSGNGFLRISDSSFSRKPYIVVRGTITPDATGEYFLSGQHNGQNYYTREDGSYVVWFEPDPFTLDQWRISESLDDDPVLWASPYNSVNALFGEYSPVSGSGEARVWSYLLDVDGDLSPDATGEYSFSGEYNDYGYWEHNEGGWFLYWRQDWWQIADQLVSDFDVPPLDLVSWSLPVGWPPSPGSYIGSYTPLNDSEGDAVVSDPLFLNPYDQYILQYPPSVFYPIKSTLSSFPETYKVWLRVRSVYGLFSAGIYLDSVLKDSAYSTSISSEWSWISSTLILEDSNIKELGIKIHSFGSELDKVFITPESSGVIPSGLGPLFNPSPYITVHAKIYKTDNLLPSVPLYIYDYKNSLENIIANGWYNFDTNFLDNAWSESFYGKYAFVLFSAGTNHNQYLIWDQENSDEYTGNPSAVLNK